MVNRSLLLDTVILFTTTAAPAVWRAPRKCLWLSIPKLGTLDRLRMRKGISPDWTSVNPHCRSSAGKSCSPRVLSPNACGGRTDSNAHGACIKSVRAGAGAPPATRRSLVGPSCGRRRTSQNVRRWTHLK
jgi:hypothetical protein